MQTRFESIGDLLLQYIGSNDEESLFTDDQSFPTVPTVCPDSLL